MMKRFATWVFAGIVGVTAGFQAEAATITLGTDDTSVVSAFGESGQGWWNSIVNATDSNQNYASSGSYRGFYTFDLSDPALTGETITSAVLRLQAFSSGGTGTLNIYDVTSDVAAVNNNVGTNAGIWNDLGSGTLYGSLAITATPLVTDILEITLNASAISALNAAIGNGFFAFGGTSDMTSLFYGSSSNGNQQLVLETASATVPLPASLPLIAIGLGAIGLLRRRKSN